MGSFTDNLYLWLDIITLLGPLLLSFDKKVAFYKNWKRLFIGVILMMLVFIPWDIAFTVNGIWGFNPRYLSGISLFSLPIEEWLFFIVVPYACVFIYECCKAYFKERFLDVIKPLFYVLAVVLSVVGIVSLGKWYTSLNFLGAAIILVVALQLKVKNLGFFLMAYLISLVPFLCINGILTGSFIDEPIVWYNNQENLGIRIFTIPIEDSIYLLFFFLLVIIPYEKMRHHS